VPAAWLAADGDYNVVCPALGIVAHAAGLDEGLLPFFPAHFDLYEESI
jgi:hypothetical protein